jgi:hypothetical protein
LIQAEFAGTNRPGKIGKRLRISERQSSAGRCRGRCRYDLGTSRKLFVMALRAARRRFIPATLLPDTRLAMRADLRLAAGAEFLLIGERERYPRRRQVEAQRGEKHKASKAPPACNGPECEEPGNKSSFDCGVHGLRPAIDGDAEGYPKRGELSGWRSALQPIQARRDAVKRSCVGAGRRMTHPGRGDRLGTGRKPDGAAGRNHSSTGILRAPAGLHGSP